MEERKNIMMSKSNSKNSIRTIDLVQVGLMAAIVCIVTMTIKLPTMIGYTHLGDSMVFIAALIFGKKKGILASGIGMFLADIISGYAIWAPFTLVIKAVMALITAKIAYRKGYEAENIINNTFACVLAGIWMVLAYYVVNAFLMRYVYLDAATLKESFAIALIESIPGNIMQATVGMVIAIPIAKLLKKRIKI